MKINLKFKFNFLRSFIITRKSFSTFIISKKRNDETNAAE